MNLILGVAGSHADVYETLSDIRKNGIPFLVIGYGNSSVFLKGFIVWHMDGLIAKLSIKIRSEDEAIVKIMLGDVYKKVIDTGFKIQYKYI